MRPLYFTVIVVAMGWSYVSVELRPLTSPFLILRYTSDYGKSVEWTIVTTENGRIRRKFCPVLFSIPQIAPGPPWKQTRASAMKFRQLSPVLRYGRPIVAQDVRKKAPKLSTETKFDIIRGPQIHCFRFRSDSFPLTLHATPLYLCSMRNQAMKSWLDGSVLSLGQQSKSGPCQGS